jgi:hypothetical protein
LKSFSPFLEERGQGIGDLPLSLGIEKIESIRINGCRAWIKAISFGLHKDEPVAITNECVTLTQLEQEINRLQEDLKQILEEARQKFPREAPNANQPKLPL